MADLHDVAKFYGVKYTNQIQLMLQQSHSVFKGFVDEGSYTGADRGQVVKSIGKVDFNEITSAQYFDEVPLIQPDHTQRWIFPTNYDLGIGLSPLQLEQLPQDPKPAYTESIYAAYKRSWDAKVIAAATGVAKVGINNNTVDTPLPGSQIIADGGDGLTLDKMIAAKEKLITAFNDPTAERFLVLSERQGNELLTQTQVTSIDYNTQKTLVNGKVDSFLGFKILYSEQLTKDTGIRQCFAYVKSGLHLGTWQDIKVEINQMNTKRMAWQLYPHFTIGATRTDEMKVVRIDCKEA